MSNNKICTYLLTYIRLCRTCRYLANLTKHNAVLKFDPLAPLCEHMTSSTKWEVHKYCIVVRGRPIHSHR